MKKIAVFMFLFVTCLSCKDEVVKKPKHLVEKDIMMNIMYDLSLFEAMKYQSASTLDSAKITATQYIYQKYQVDSLLFAQSNKYYAADFKEYKKMYDKIASRVEKKKTDIEAKIKADRKKASKKAPIKKELNLNSQNQKKIQSPL
jgi:Skp family chaperone for outer membrane proteins